MKPYHLAILVCIALTACRSDNDTKEDDTPNGNDQQLVFSSSINWGDTPITDPNTVNYTEDQRPVRVVLPQIYLSELRFVTANGDTVHENEVVLLSSENNKITMSSVPNDNYEQIIFTLGLPYSINKSVRPIDFDMGHPLAPQTPNMWWSWDDGYIFARIEGRTNHETPPVDTLSNGFSWHIGFSENAIEDITLNLPTTKDWTLTFDVENMFSEAQIPEEMFTMNVRRALIDKNIAFIMSQSFDIK